MAFSGIVHVNQYVSSHRESRYRGSWKYMSRRLTPDPSFFLAAVGSLMATTLNHVSRRYNRAEFVAPGAKVVHCGVLREGSDA